MQNYGFVLVELSKFYKCFPTRSLIMVRPAVASRQRGK